MGAPLSKDIRERVVAAYEAGEGTYDELAARFSVGPATVSRLLRSYREHGSVDPRPRGGGMPPKIGVEDLRLLRRIVASASDLTAAELARLWTERTGTQLSRAAMQRALQRAGLTRKKRHS